MRNNLCLVTRLLSHLPTLPCLNLSPSCDLLFKFQKVQCNIYCTILYIALFVLVSYSISHFSRKPEDTPKRSYVMTLKGHDT